MIFKGNLNTVPPTKRHRWKEQGSACMKRYPPLHRQANTAPLASGRRLLSAMPKQKGLGLAIKANQGDLQDGFWVKHRSRRRQTASPLNGLASPES